MTLSTLLLVSALVFIVAALYSTVGHGGASGYLAVLSFFVIAPREMSSTALMLNVLVAGVGFISFLRAQHFDWKLSWPFVAVSIPTAFIGGLLQISERTYSYLLAGVLVVAAYRLALGTTLSKKERATERPSLSVALPVGAGIGLLSGIVGVGGGIFLSPLLIFLRWADPKKTAAVSAFFILVNSIAGIGGRFVRGGMDVVSFFPLVVTAFLGGLVGSYYGATKFSGLTLRRLLAFVLIIASAKLFLTAH